jgi:hypothetical protein
MSDAPENQWAELEARAQRLLEHPKDLEPREVIRLYGSLLRLWHYPVYGSQTTWTILSPGKKASPGSLPMVREVVWDRDADNERLFASAESLTRDTATQPTLRVRDAVLPAPMLDRFLAQGASLSVPVIVLAKSGGVDGEYFGLETYEVSPFVRLQWWCDGPTEWRHFTDWVTALRTFALRQLDQTG